MSNIDAALFGGWTDVMIPDEIVTLPMVKEYFLVFESVTKVRGSHAFRGVRVHISNCAVAFDVNHAQYAYEGSR